MIPIRLFVHRPAFLLMLLLLTLSTESFGQGQNSGIPSPIHSIQPVIVLAQADTATSASQHQDPFSRAMAAMQSGDDQTALIEMQQAIAIEPSNLEYQYLLGNIYSRLNRLEEAENIFQALLRTEPDRFGKCYFDLSAIHLKRHDDTGALDYLQKAKSVDSGRASFESGLIFMRIKQFDRAISAFDEAIVQKPEITYECQLQKASAYANLEQPSKAKEILKKVLAMDLSPERREEAARLYEELESGKPVDKRWYLAVNLGVQYDDNVFQQPLEQINLAPSTQGTKGKSDVAYVGTLYGKYDFWKTGSWKSGLSYLHYQLIYQDLTENNLLGARPSLYLEYGKAPYFAAIEYAYSHYWVDNDSRVDIHALYPRFLWVHNDRLRSEFYGGLERRLYLDTTPDDWHSYAGITEYWMFNKGMSHVRAGYMFDYDDFTPTERGDIIGNRFSIGLNLPIYKDKYFFDIEGIYQMRHYQFDPNIDSDEKRNDDEFHINAQLYGHLSKHLDIRLGYYQTWNESDVTNTFGIDPYHFRRGVSLLMLSYIF
ncbi:tetratricopeptide repeat protein [Desulfatirhabdium butyrativorans]|uniref:tetratricopeptide repeat protein n=1 Tax=Desulfatirhabdium butyrativorans TaxID=340467 RepID=UPI000408E84B|nr:tetratricopeptide repeat protein [Desulfatirhabdium butyrativorans]